MSGISSCFVIGPIGDEHAPAESPPRVSWEKALDVYEKIIQPACTAFGITPERADEIASPGEITEQIFTRLREADLVIADLSGANPNVMYELGLRHSQRKPVIQIGEYGTLPFDVRAIRTIPFTRTPRGYVDGREKLERAIQSVRDGNWQPVTATRVMAGEQGPNRVPPLEPAHVAEPGAIEPERADASTPAEEELGFLELLADMESAMPEMNETITRMSAVISDIGAIARKGVEDMKASDAAGGGARGRVTAAAAFAERLDNPTDELEALAAAYEDQLRRVDRGLNHIITLVEEDPSRRGDLGELPARIHSMADAADAGLGQQEVLAAQVAQLGGVTRALRPRTTRLRDALLRVAGTRATIRRWSDRLRAVEPTAAQRGPADPTARVKGAAPSSCRRRRRR